MRAMDWKSDLSCFLSFANALPWDFQGLLWNLVLLDANHIDWDPLFSTLLYHQQCNTAVCYYRDSHILQAFLHTPTHLSIPVNFFCSTITLGFVRQSWCNYRHHTAASKYYEGFVHSRLFFLTCSHPISLKQQEASRHWKHILKELCQRALLTNP